MKYSQVDCVPLLFPRGGDSKIKGGGQEEDFEDYSVIGGNFWEKVSDSEHMGGCAERPLLVRENKKKPK